MSYILITGGSKNIGRETALFLAKNGYDIAIHYKDGKDSAESLVHEIKSFGVKSEALFGDFSSINGLKEFVFVAKSKLKVIKGLINNAAVYKVGSLEDTTYEELAQMFQVNLFSSFYLIKSFVPELKREEGSIINLGICGLLTKFADEYAAAFQMSKLSLLMLTKSFAKSLAKDRIRVNMISPGYTETSIDLPRSAEVVPLSRFAKNREIAEAILFFLKSPYITGQNLEIAGGLRL